MTQNTNLSYEQLNNEAKKRFVPYQEQAENLNLLRELYGLTKQEYQLCLDENVSYYHAFECPVWELLDSMNCMRIKKSDFKLLTDDMIAAEYKIIQPELFSYSPAFKKKYENEIKEYDAVSMSAYGNARHLDVCPSGAKVRAENAVLDGERKEMRRIILVGSAISGLALIGALCTGFYAWYANKPTNTPQKADNEAKLIQKAQIEKAQNTR